MAAHEQHLTSVHRGEDDRVAVAPKPLSPDLGPRSRAESGHEVVLLAAARIDDGERRRRVEARHRANLRDLRCESLAHCTVGVDLRDGLVEMPTDVLEGA